MWPDAPLIIHDLDGNNADTCIGTSISTLRASCDLFDTEHAQQGEMNVKTQLRRTLFSRKWTLSLAVLLLSGGTASADVSGLNAGALDELRAAGVDKYLGTSVSVKSTHGDWTKHAFDPRYTPDASYPLGVRPDGPVCIAGTN